ncbi:PorT family protein [Niabella beijingensis]|uniref:PorT family protein n=1 Tax=Niabella beijingensis TaxID=2872700 RepID=UPI001CBF3F1E|nr:PorT family protein [Niabella beijingensis]MBZ4190045.1 PorT family protein [Niabella beijingensis]
MKTIRVIVLGTILMAPVCLWAQHKQKVDTTEITVKVISRNNKDSVIISDNGQPWVKASRVKNVTTSWFGIDLGFVNFVDNTIYTDAATQAFAPGATDSWLDLRSGKSVNVNIWILSQKINLVKHVVNLKYSLGLELNNYRFKNPVRFNPKPGTDAAIPAVVYMDEEPGRTYRKNKLAADYLTLPVMLNFTIPTKNRKIVEINRKNVRVKASKEFGVSAGISAGYLYSARNKYINSDEGKHKFKDDFSLNPWKISYVGEVNLGYLGVYGSFATKSMFKRGLDLTPYIIGVRLGL